MEKRREEVQEDDKRKRRRKKRESSSESDTSSEDAEDERRRRKAKKKNKEEKRQRRKDRKKHKRDRESDDESSEGARKKRLLKEAKKFLKKSKKQSRLEERKDAQQDFAPITVEDYFQKNPELATWMKEDRGIFFSDLSSEQTHELFKDFMAIYNKGKLPEKYYTGVAKAQRTTHNWNIRGRGEIDPADEEDRRAADRTVAKIEKKKWKKDQEVLLDEMLPKATGREAMLEKKAVRREQARDRDASPEMMRESDVMGGGDDFQQRLARERAWREKKAAQRADAAADKVASYNNAEAARLDQFKALIQASGGKISMAKRAPP